MNIPKIGELFSVADPILTVIHRVATTYTKAGVVIVYRNINTNRYLSTTDGILRQYGMDADTLARYLCHIAMDSNSDAFKTMMNS